MTTASYILYSQENLIRANSPIKESEKEFRFLSRVSRNPKHGKLGFQGFGV
jgi:hypothetical protein